MKYLSILICVLIINFGLINSACGQKRKKTTETKSQRAVEREAEFYFTEGEKYFILEDYAKALLYYQKSLDVYPENASAHYKIAEVLSSGNRAEDLNKAATNIQTALRLDKKNKYFYLLAAKIYSSLNEIDKAIHTYEQLLSEVPDTQNYLYDLAGLYQYNNKSTEAIKTYDRAEAHFGINETSSIQKIKLYLDAHKNKEAMEEGKKLIDAFPDQEKFVMAFAEVLSQNGLNQEAINYLENFIAQNQEAPNSKMLLAGLYRDAHQEQKAKSLLSEVFKDVEVELDSKLLVLGTYNAELNANKAKGIHDEIKEKFVVSLFQELKEQYPGEGNVHVLGGDLFLTLGRDEEALDQYLEVIDSDPGNYEVWQNILYLEIKLHQFAQAIQLSERALEMFPNQSMFYYFNGYANLQEKHFREATSALEQAKKLNRTDNKINEEINSMLGEAYHALKEFVKSDKSYEDALLINPENQTVLNNYSYYLAIRKQNLEKAERMSSQLIKLSPDNPTYLDTYAWVLYMSKKYKEAKKVMERAIETDQAKNTYFEHYGDILFKLGDIDGAVQQWEKAKSMDDQNELLNKKIANRRIYE